RERLAHRAPAGGPRHGAVRKVKPKFQVPGFQVKRPIASTWNSRAWNLELLTMADGKWIDGLSPATPIADAAKAVLVARFGVVKHFLPLAAERPNEDVEYVHQLRVGTRRAAAALRVFEDALPRKLLKATKRTLRRIRRAAGDARDWDVFIQTLPTEKAFA